MHGDEYAWVEEERIGKQRGWGWESGAAGRTREPTPRKSSRSDVGTKRDGTEKGRGEGEGKGSASRSGLARRAGKPENPSPPPTPPPAPA